MTDLVNRVAQVIGDNTPRRSSFSKEELNFLATAVLEEIRYPVIAMFKMALSSDFPVKLTADGYWEALVREDDDEEDFV